MNKLIFLSVMIFILFVSCSSKKGYEVIFKTANGKITEGNAVFYTNDRGTIFLKLNDHLVDRLSTQPITKIEFNVNGKNYICEPLDQFFSREKPSSDFVYAVKNKTKDLIIDFIDGNKFIVIVSEKISIENLISEGVLMAYETK